MGFSALDGLVNIMPMGRPHCAEASGKLIDGWPVKLNSAV